MSNENDIINTDRIKFVSNKSFSLFDTNEMLCESDIFCTDCSTLSTEAAILKGHTDGSAKVKEEIAELPKTKSGMMAAVYEKLGKLKKDQIATNFESILSSLSIQEGSEDLFIINRKTGKQYKFKLEEV